VQHGMCAGVKTGKRVVRRWWRGSRKAPQSADHHSVAATSVLWRQEPCRSHKPALNTNRAASPRGAAEAAVGRRLRDAAGGGECSRPEMCAQAREVAGMREVLGLVTPFRTPCCVEGMAGG